MTDITRRAFARNVLIAGGGAMCGAALGYPLVPAARAQGNPAPDGAPMHGIAMHGDPLYPADFTHYKSVNPNAPKGGRLVQGAVGAFDSLNPFIVRGTAPPFVRWNIVESLMARSPDEAFTCYGLLARSVATDDARSYVAFEIDERARFSDGTPGDGGRRAVLLRAAAPEGPARSPHLLRQGGQGGGDGAAVDPLHLRRRRPRTAADPGADAGAGAPCDQSEDLRGDHLHRPARQRPYVQAEVKPGESVILTRNADYWGRDLPVNRGNFNFDSLRYDFYRDVNAQFEAFKRGLYDIRFETDPGRWKTGYDFPAVRDGRIVMEQIETGMPKPYSALIFNMRRDLFADVRVRQAMVELFDFEWANDNLYFGLYRRNGSFYDGSELSALGRPAEARERELLTPFPDAVLPEVMDGTWYPPRSDGSGRDRERLRKALDLFAQAGWELKGGTLTSKATGKPFAPELIVGSKDQERLALAYQNMLRRAGVTLNIRLVDNVQFEARKQTYDYDMVPYIWDQSLSPGNEQAFYFGSGAADTPGTRNFMGLKSKAADAMIEALLAARERDDFVSAVRALDRVLMSARFSVPLFYTPGQWVARWRKVERPGEVALSGTLAETWWQAPGAP